MSECYYSWCPHHALSEPICTRNRCLASPRQMVLYQQLRREQLDNNTKEATRASEFRPIS